MKDATASDEERDRMFLYNTLMEELSYRLNAITLHLKNASGLSTMVVYESCHLQLRMICEVLAMSCLVAHGEMGKRLMKTWEADRLLEEMQKLNPHFYPQPAKYLREGNRVQIVGAAEGTSPLTRLELAKLWSDCGGALHAAPLKKHLKLLEHDGPPSLDVITHWQARIIALLNTHLIALSESRLMFVSMQDPITGRPQSSVLNLSLSDDTAYVEMFVMPKHKT